MKTNTPGAVRFCNPTVTGDTGRRYDVVVGPKRRPTMIGYVRQVIEQVSWQRSRVAGWVFFHDEDSPWSVKHKTRMAAASALQAVWLKSSSRPAHIPEGWMPIERCPDCEGWLHALIGASGDPEEDRACCGGCATWFRFSVEPIIWGANGVRYFRGNHTTLERINAKA